MVIIVYVNCLKYFYDFVDCLILFFVEDNFDDLFFDILVLFIDSCELEDFKIINDVNVVFDKEVSMFVNLIFVDFLDLFNELDVYCIEKIFKL